jgi:tetratricopeptide (TPR) repeat protein
LAEQLYKETKIYNIAVFFKQVAAGQLRYPGEQLRKVLAFKQQIEDGKKYLFKSFSVADEFRELLEAQLGAWLRKHEGTGNAPSAGERTIVSSPSVVTPVAAAQARPNFDYWIVEAAGLADAEPANYSGSLFCAERALAAASTEIERAQANNLLGIAYFYLKNPEEAIAAFTAIVERLRLGNGPTERALEARALVNKGITLGQLGRSEDAVAVYDDVVARFGSAAELQLREQVARAPFNKGFTLGQLGRSEDAIGVAPAGGTRLAQPCFV